MSEPKLRSAGSPSRKLYRKAMESKYGKDWKERTAKCGHNKVIESVCQDCGKRDGSTNLQLIQAFA